VPTPPRPGKLSTELSQALRGLRSVRPFARGSTLFREGSAVTGIYLVESGAVRVLLSNGGMERQLLDVAGPGTVLGLSESMSGEKHRSTAEAEEYTMAVFIPREELLEFLREHGDFCMQVVRLLSDDLHGLYHKFRSITAHPGRPRQRALDEQLN
jgi:CRP/FNR family cyclic AMP-dependent transcriptional regulator